MPPPAARHHAEWLSLIEVSGPFLSLPALTRAFPQGLEAVEPETAATVRRAYEEWQADPGLHGRWVRWVLGELLGFTPAVLADGPAVPATLTVPLPEHGVTLRPDLAVLDPAQDGAARLLVTVWPAGQALGGRLEGERWPASPQERMADLLRGAGVRLGLVTNGERWTLVNAFRGQASGFATWDAGIWLEERATLNAFVTLLSARRFFAAAGTDTLEALLAESASAQQDVTDQLGRQVRAAVEMLVDAFSRADRERQGRLLAGVSPQELYEGAVTAMMRLVFLLFAEQRELLPIRDGLYAASYAASTLLDQLQQEAQRIGSEEPLERRCSAWQRLLATFRMVHGGVQHERLRLPAYGGGLFDPDRFPFLEGRARGQAAAPEPVPIDDRTVLHLLDALLVLRRRPGQGAGPAEAQRLSYRGLDVEQIGHVYEGLLDHTAVRVDEPALGLDGKHEPELALRALERAAAQGHEALTSLLAAETGESRRWVERRLSTPPGPAARSRLLAACAGDQALCERAAPYHALLRRDLRGDPLVFLPGSIYVTKAGERRASGTYYTPRALAEEVVRHALEPLAYSPGPADGSPPGTWALRPAAELLSLKVCDLAMGSGAFLVAACRYLADRVVEAWELEGARAVPGVDGGTVALPTDPDDRAILARRLVADRCLYGVDRNPMAVEMAKLSLWLVTLAKDRPFTFLDHALRAGDSLLGLTSAEQLVNLHPDPARGSAIHLTLTGDITEVVRAAVERAAGLRRRIAATPVLEARHATEKERLLAEAEEATAALRTVADLVTGAALAAAGKGGEALDSYLLAAAPTVAEALDPAVPRGRREAALTELRIQASSWLQQGLPPGRAAEQRACFHWPLEFPEVFLDGGGLDAVVGNPPFQGGQKITGTLGSDYREWLVTWLAGGTRGSADLAAYFFLRAAQLLRGAGGLGLLATNTIAQGDTREVGLDQLTARRWTISRAVKSRPWPGDASLEVAQVWLHRGAWQGTAVLDGQPVRGITPELEPSSRVRGKPHRLHANAGQCFQGSNVLGTGFLLTPEEAQRLIERDPRNADVLFPYLNGEDLNSSPTQSPSRWVINFFDWPLARAETYPDCLAIVREKVKPERERNQRTARRERWWQFAERAPQLYRAIEGLERVLVIARVSKVVAPLFVPAGIVCNEQTCVFAYNDDAHFGVLSSAFHWWWAVKHASTLETRVRYTPTDCFETFPQPRLTEGIARAGRALDEHRRAVMLARQEGLTATYNRVHDPAERAQDVQELRRLHVELDQAVAAAYGWEDLPLDHGFRETRQGVRYTLGAAVRTEVLDRLLELNHGRYRAEQAQGLARPKRRGGAGRRRTPGAGQVSLGL